MAGSERASGRELLEANTWLDIMITVWPKKESLCLISLRVAELPSCRIASKSQIESTVTARRCYLTRRLFFFKQKTLKKKRPKMRDRLFLLVSIDRNGRSNSVKPRDHCVDIVENEGDIKKKRICKRTSRDVMEL